MARIRPVAVIGCWLVAAVCPVRALPQTAETAAVQVQMRNVRFHVDSTAVLDIQRLRGELRRAAPEHPPYLDDKTSFTLVISSSRIGVTPVSLTDILNHYTFAYPGSPLRRLRVTLHDGELEQQGAMHGISFTILDELTLTPEGELRLHPTSIKAAGIKVGGLMKFFGLRLQKLIDTKQARGVRMEGNDFLLSPTGMLPPPAIEGHLSAAAVTDSAIVLDFDSAGPPRGTLKLPVAQAGNYMFFRGGVLRFGKLTMHDADLLILDAASADPFDFFLDHYNDQLVAGYSRNTADHGLIVVMPDYDRLHARKGADLKLDPPRVP